MTPPHPTADAHAEAHRTVTVRATLLTAAALLVLWGASWGLSFVDLGAWSFPVALVIAAAKALLVALFFMELVTEPASVNLALLTGVALFLVLLGFTVADVATRECPEGEGPPCGAAQ
jgi:cytochrome c oxidase subunit 4